MQQAIYHPFFSIKNKNNLEVFILGHNKTVLPPRKNRHLTNIDLNELNIGIWNTDQLSESRIYFSHLNSNADYLGFATHQWNLKFPYVCRLENLNLLKLNPDVVWYAKQAPPSWATDSDICHAGMFALLQEAAQISKLKLGLSGFWCNCFICHRDIYQQFLIFFHEMFAYFHGKYQFNFPFFPLAPHRHAAYFYERITTLYFSNRKDLQLKQIGNEHSILF